MTEANGELPEHQHVFDRVLEQYNEGIEPLENWDTADLVALGHAIDAELQARADMEQAIGESEDEGTPQVWEDPEDDRDPPEPY